MVVTLGNDERRVTAERVVIAVGTRPARPPSRCASTSARCSTPTGFSTCRSIPDALVVVGAGVIGIEYASMFAALGTKVTVVEQREHLLEFCDRQVTEALQYHLRDLGVTFRFGDAVVGVESHDGGTITHLQSGKRIASNAVMYSAGSAGRHRPAQPGRRGNRGRATAGGSGWTSTTAPPPTTSTRWAT